MFSWKCRTTNNSHCCPRQFEYHPTNSNVILYGTQDSQVGILNTASSEFSKPLGAFGRDKYDPILGLCWLRLRDGKFVAGSSSGKIKLTSFGYDQSADTMVQCYPDFPNLSSVHIDPLDTRLLVSGSSRSVTLFDLETGQIAAEYKNIHLDNINISRFSNSSPSIFATCSFDSTVKMWDTRSPAHFSSVRSITTPGPIVMIHFCPNDAYILSAGADNEVNQYLTANGKLHVHYDLPRRNSSSNFTRAYYSASGAFIATGGSEEDCVYFMCSSTGELLSSMPVSVQAGFPSPYIQSLRMCPTVEKKMSVLVNDRVLDRRQIFEIELPEARREEVLFPLKEKGLFTSSESILGEDRKQKHIEHVEIADRIETTELGDCSDDKEVVYYPCCLPPSEKYVQQLDCLFHGVLKEEFPPASVKTGWSDGLVYLTYLAQGRHLSPEDTDLVSGCPASIWSILKYPECKNELSMCIPIHAAVAVVRCKKLGACIQTAMRDAEADSRLQSDYSSKNDTALCIDISSLVSMKSHMDVAIMKNVILRYIYSSTISVDVLLKLALQDPLSVSDPKAEGVSMTRIIEELRDKCGPSYSASSSIGKLIDVLFTTLRIAIELDLEELQLHCDCLLGSFIRLPTVLRILPMAVAYQRHQLQNACERFLAGHVALVLSTYYRLLDHPLEDFDDVMLNMAQFVGALDVSVSKENFTHDDSIKSSDEKASYLTVGSVLSPEAWVEITDRICSILNNKSPKRALSNINIELNKNLKKVRRNMPSGLQDEEDCHVIAEASSASLEEVGLIEELIGKLGDAEDTDYGSTGQVSSTTESEDDETDRSTLFITPVKVLKRFPRERDSSGRRRRVSAKKGDIPGVFGQSNIVVFDRIVLQVGGRNSYTLFCNDYLKAFYPTNNTWNYLQTFGDIPAMVSSTTAVPLQPKSTRHVLLIDEKYKKWSFHLLDAMTMNWSALDKHPEFSAELSRRHRSAICPVQIHHQSHKGAVDDCTDFSLVLVWGGYCFDSRSAKNDLWQINVSRKSKNFPAHVMKRKVVTLIEKDSCLSADDSSSCSAMELPISGKEDFIALLSTTSNMKLAEVSRFTSSFFNLSSNLEVTCSEVKCTGTPPPPRWGAGTAVLLASPAKESSSARMIIFGGIGPLDLSMDHVFSLQCGNPYSMHWEETEVSGASPGSRYGHTMTTATPTTIIVYGGCCFSRMLMRYTEANNDSVFVLHYQSHDYKHSLRLRWSSLNFTTGLVRPLRMKHDAIIWTEPGSDERAGLELIVFGGASQSGGINGENCVEEDQRGAHRIKLGDYQAIDVSVYPQRLQYINTTPNMMRAPCTIHKEFEQLFTESTFSDLTLKVLMTTDGMRSTTEYNLSCHSFMLALQPSSLVTSLEWSRDVRKVSLDDIAKGFVETADANKLAGMLDLELYSDVTAVKKLLHYLYTGIPKITSNDVLQLAAIADLHVLHSLFLHCEGFLILALNKGNACYLAQLTEDYVMSNMVSLRLSAIRVIRENYSELFETMEYQTMSAELRDEVESQTGQELLPRPSSSPNSLDTASSR